MQLYLAMSCLQGRPMESAFDELCALSPNGVQLTAGNAPTYDFEEHVFASGMSTRTHHGFSKAAYRQNVWTEGHELTGYWNSVHPPKKAAENWLPQIETDIIFETMYPGYPIGNGDMIDAAMTSGLALAVDVSHIFIQLEQGAMQDKTWKRLQEYSRIEEIHVSANDGRRDSHQQITANTFGLEWVSDRTQTDQIPVVLESYFHKLSHDERILQMDIVRGET